MGDTMTCPICESTDTSPCEAPEDAGDWQCQNPDCQAKFLSAQEA